MDRNRPLTSLASLVHSIKDMIIVIAKYIFRTPQSAGTAAANANHSGMVGIARRNSIILCIIRSVIPPRSPERPPSRMPRNIIKITATNPIDIETLVPYIMRDQTSLPIRSEPKKYSGTGSFFPTS